MKTLLQLIKRNVKLYFKDKGMFLTSLITPAILLLLYATFLANVYRDSFTSNIPQEITVSDKVIGGVVGGQLISSLLAVSCITVSFCSNFVMVQDKVNGVRKDLLLSPVKSYTLSLSYYLATVINSLIVCFVATELCFVYLACVGWYLSVADVFLLILDVFLLVIFGTALSSVINFFLSTQGKMSAVGPLVSSGYGFICGAYMPISQFGEGLQNVLSFLPGTYGTSLIRNHSLAGVFEELSRQGFSSTAVGQIKNSVDCNIYFFGNKVEIGVMYLVLIAFIIALVGIYIGVNLIKPIRKSNKVKPCKAEK
jgi:multidrug/hemolysin transport system permease protein